MISLPENIATIIEKHLKGLQSSADMQVLQEWRMEKEEHELFYQQLSKLWKESGVVLEEPVYDTEKAWNKLDFALKRGKRPDFRLLLAACFIGILIVASWMLFSKREVTMLAANNEKLTLPDGSTVILRKGASISFPAAFAERAVTLKGEAYFDIRPDKDHPFRIQTTRATLEVLGTSFVINSSQLYDRLVVSTGKVSFNKNIVTAQQTAILDEKGIDIKPVKNSNYLSWHTGILKFDNEPITQVAAELSDYYNLPIKPDSGLEQYTITAKFDHQPVEQVLEEIKLLVNLSHRNQHDTILLFKP
jgi:transmembrane sensor